MRKLKLYDTDDNLILSYTTDHEFHGSQLIEIKGPVLIGKCLVDYLAKINGEFGIVTCLLYTSPSPRDRTRSRMPSSA